MLADINTIDDVVGVINDVSSLIGLAAYLGAAIAILWIWIRSKSFIPTFTMAIVALTAAWVAQPGHALLLAHLMEGDFGG